VRSRLFSVLIAAVGIALAGDVGVTAIVAPPTTLDSGRSIAPACSVRSWGYETLDFVVRMRIGGTYNATETVFGLQPNELRLVTFPTWVSGPKGAVVAKCSTELGGDSVPGNDRLTRPVHVWSWPFGQVYIKSSVTGAINGHPIRATGSGRLDTTGLWPGALWQYYDTILPSFHPFLTLTPSPMEPESAALNLWQVGLGNLRSVYMYAVDPDTPGPDDWVLMRRTSMLGDTMQVSDSLFGSFPGDDDVKEPGRCVSHWVQEDSLIWETDTFELIKHTGETLRVNVSAVHIGVRQRLPFPEVSWVYWADSVIPESVLRTAFTHIQWWGRTMPENHGRQINACGRVGGAVNGQAVSGRIWGMIDTTGTKPAYIYGAFDSLSMPGSIAWVMIQDYWKDNNLRLGTDGAQSLWDLSGGAYNVTRVAKFPSGDTIRGDIVASADGTNGWQVSTLSGNYHGENGVVNLLPESKLWHQADTLTMLETGRTTVLMSNGDSVACDFSSRYQSLRRRLNFDEIVSLTFDKVRDSSGFFALEVRGTVDSAPSAIAAPAAERRPQTWDISVTPNPAIGSASVSYVLPASGPCRLNLYDISGKLVATLASGHERAGAAGLRLQTSSLPKGIYVLRLENNGGTRVTKLVVE
jgi:hypothetical protein